MIMTTSAPSRSLKWLIILNYAIAVFSATTSAVVAFAVLPSGGTDPALLLFLSVVMFVALAAGPGPAAFAAVLTLLSLQYPLLSTGHALVLQSGEILRMGLFIVASVLVVVLTAARKRTSASLQRLGNDQQMTIRQLQEQNDRLRAESAERSAAATNAQEAERELRLTVDTVPALIARYRADGFMDFRNKNWREYTGLSQDNFEGRRWGSALHPDDEEMIEREWREHIATGEPFELEQRLRKADGEHRWHRVRRVPLRDETGEVIKWYAIAFDVDDRRRTEDALRMGQFTASIAHEVNQPLAAVLTNAETALRWLAHQPPNLEKARASIERVINDGKRAADIVSRIRDFSKKAPVRKESLEVNEAILEIIGLTRGAMSDNGILATMQLAEGLPHVSGDRVHLQQVILNLIMNAIEAMSEVSDGSRELQITTSEAEAGSVLVAVSDSGPGLPPASVARTFEAFYTTKAAGLGIGLSICRSIVDAHGGRLWATPNEPRGAVFCMTLPIGEKSLENLESSEAESLKANATGCTLGSGDGLAAGRASVDIALADACERQNRLRPPDGAGRRAGRDIRDRAGRSPSLA